MLMKFKEEFDELKRQFDIILDQIFTCKNAILALQNRNFNESLDEIESFSLNLYGFGKIKNLPTHQNEDFLKYCEVVLQERLSVLESKKSKLHVKIVNLLTQYLNQLT
jgi:hypothetical protein